MIKQVGFRCVLQTIKIIYMNVCQDEELRHFQCLH